MITSKKLPQKDELHVTEGVSGGWHYHLSEPTTNARAICGAQTMYTAIPLSAWGRAGHLGETYCMACAETGTAALQDAKPAT